MHPLYRWALAGSLILALLGVPALAAQDDSLAQPDEVGGAKPASIERRVYECFVREDYEQAIAIINRHLEGTPNDAAMLYNLACAYCLLEKWDESATSLLRAFRAGFDDIEHLRTDPDLQGLRTHPTFRRILEEADRASRRSGRSALETWKSAYGEEVYRYASDDKRRINYAVALSEDSFDVMRRMLEDQADQLTRTLFDGEAPGYEILIAVPTPEDADKFFEGQDNIGGMYHHGLKRLVARDIGSSLRHEFFHALHFAHMERLRQQHPLWIQEGLATLYEDYELSKDGTIRFVPNDRQFMVKTRARANRLIKWEDLFDLTAEGFMAQAQRNYPQVRSVFEYVAAQGKLEAWYRAYVQGFREDRSGRAAFESVFAQPLDEIERDWRIWVVEQPALDVRIAEGDAALGVRSRENLSNDGVVITDIVPGSTAARSRLRRGDVIVAVDGRRTPAMIDLRQIIASKNVGDEIELRVRRGEEYLTMSLTLRPLAGGRT